jgi:formylmethanofuran dehydrogenase subunit E
MLDINAKSLWDAAVEFHGHSCPGIAIGIVACKTILEEFGNDAKNRDLIAIVENDACAVDAIQKILGCTFGNGKMIHRDYGKSVYTFFNCKTGKAIRLSVRKDATSLEPESKKRLEELFEKVRKGTATELELEEFKKHRQNQIENILKLGRDIFTIQRVNISPPPEQKVGMGESINCDNCGEPTLVSRVKQLNEMKLCIPCYEKLTV